MRLTLAQSEIGVHINISIARFAIDSDRAEKLVYMFCNEKILNILESEDYEERIPIWMYNCSDKDDNELENTMENNEDANEAASERQKLQ